MRLLGGEGQGMAIRYEAKPQRTRNEEIIAGIRNSVGAGPPINREMKAKRLTAEVAVMMALLHGGDWRVQFEPEKGFLLISRRGRRCR